VAGGAPAAADEAEDLRRQVEAQNELIRRQAEALEQMGDRVRILEDEHAAAPHIPQAAGQPDIGGLRVAEEPWGSFNFKFYTYVRYLNQKGLDDDYTDAFGRTHELDRRQDIQLQKVKLDTFGWVMARSWATWFACGAPTRARARGAVVVAGFLQYKFYEASARRRHHGAPGTVRWAPRSGSSQPADRRRVLCPSYTSGIWAKGTLFEE
jgi:hypothetical protein